MKCDGDVIRLAATDLSNHLACRHLTELNRATAEGRKQRPDWADPDAALLRERGLRHERAYIDSLRAQSLSIVDLSGERGAAGEHQTTAAMQQGADVIVQASLRVGRWGGIADVLRRVEVASALGDWSYEVADTKLGQITRGGTVLQLCLYSDLLAIHQGAVPSMMHVIKPGAPPVQESFTFGDFQAYYRLVKHRLETTIEAAPAETYPSPAPMCDICRWWKECDTRRHADDHPSLIAGASTLHVGELARQGVVTLEQFAASAAPLSERPKRGSVETFDRLHAQAQVQLEGRRQATPVYRLLPPEPGRGLARLPEPDPADIFFDLEADPFVDPGGLEYLFGFVSTELDGTTRYESSWALDPQRERRVFEQFVDFVMERWRTNPGMHVYHFSPYEPGTIKRLMSRHATREIEIDQLLRAGRFIDLHAVTRQGLHASVEKYSLKDLEQFFGFVRTQELRAASAALRRVAWALELGGPEPVGEGDRSIIEKYNEEDCLATAGLRDWLEDRRSELIGQGNDLARPETINGEASSGVQEQDQQVSEVAGELRSGLSDDRDGWGPQEHARNLLAHLLDYFRREDRCAWWEYFRLRELDGDELLEEPKAVVSLEYVSEAGGTARCPVHRYRFPPQDVALREGVALEAGEIGIVGKVEAMEHFGRTIDIRKRAAAADLHPATVIAMDRVNPAPMPESLLSLGQTVAAAGFDGAVRGRAGRDLLLKAPPRLTGSCDEALRRPGEDAVAAAVRLAERLDHGVLAIQGPPGTGKTYAGARVIAELARQGKTVGVTAISHKVIRNLLDHAHKLAAERGATLHCVHKVSKLSTDAPEHIQETTTNDFARDALQDDAVLGGTTWLWSREDMAESVDYLFIDEAGQMSLAQALAASRAAHNIILLGDPQQLEQPQRADHPEGAEVAVLSHLLDGHPTMPPEKGLFLDVTWRLHPAICQFTSEVYYEGRLQHKAGLEQQEITGPSRFAGSGLVFAPVPHDGNQNSSVEEVEAVERIVAELLQSGGSWIDGGGAAHDLEPCDILVVAPYNAHVGALSERLPGIRVGTVDKFQGQEAPVVIYSMASSSVDDAPRGMSFLFQPNRLNVATSRARCLCILVASPRLFEAECRTPQQMKWANGLCRFRALAREIAP